MMMEQIKLEKDITAKDRLIERIRAEQDNLENRRETLRNALKDMLAAYRSYSKEIISADELQSKIDTFRRAASDELTIEIEDQQLHMEKVQTQRAVEGLRRELTRLRAGR